MSEDEPVIEEYVQKIPAEDMCWMHLEPLASCGCDLSLI